MVEKKKNLAVETLRGLAILLVVVGHVIGSTPDGGMKIDFPHPLRYLYLWIDYIQMPLFTAIAGWAYAIKPFVAQGGVWTFLSKKASRLLVPMVVVGTMYFLVQYMVPGTNAKGNWSDLWRIYIFPYTLYWYLPSLFLIFVVQYAVDKLRLMKNGGGWFCCLLVAFALRSMMKFGVLMDDVPNILSFKGALGQLPYFFLGVGVVRFKEKLYTDKLRHVTGGMMLVGILLLQVEWIYPVSIVYLEYLQPIWIMFTLMLLFAIKWRSSLFPRLGEYAYAIYLFHGFCTSGGRIICNKAGCDSYVVILILSTVLAVLFPIMIAEIGKRVPWFRKLFLGG